MVTLSKSLNNGDHYQDKFTEINRVKQYLFKHTATAAMCADALNIRIPNVCRYKRELEKFGVLKIVKRSICQLTKHRADYLTCNIGGGIND